MSEIATVTIDADGTIRTLHSDRVVGLLEQLGGDMQIRRASHVEQFAGLKPEAQVQVTNVTPRGWYADMSPSGGPVAGPFTEHQAALDWEREWLIAHGFPQPAA